ncbi:predicted protein [Naegleria gruberi]|uniref:Predicted protein n=1 Tax=Naegleria gruberi TaxID=5762 RepID=D2UYI0_NAEGR|nr:uncharacterized protein NAEGRDRAFT_45181 [Naegleria gruberi]EFC50479.1 predicted protein [Naegleria gruberi]|eukprot:XP_002683223.1 predicted protein [Naegleria gruberi strain NEG-M]
MSSANREDLTLPKQTIVKIIKEHLGESIKCAADTRELIVECCVEFVQMIAAESNSICESDKRKTIAGEHVTEALRRLGYSEYLGLVNEAHNQHKVESSRHNNASKKLKNSGKTEEELISEQHKLIAQSRARLIGNGGATQTPTTAVSTNFPTFPQQQHYQQQQQPNYYTSPLVPPPLANAQRGEIIPSNI